MPPLSHDDARLAAQRKAREILRDRVIQHQAALTEEVAAAERELGPNAVAALSHEAWRGHIPADDARQLAETMIEDLQLGLSIHRRERAGWGASCACPLPTEDQNTRVPLSGYSPT